MSRRTIAVAALALVAVVGAVAAVLVLRDSGGDETAPRPLRARASLSDRIVVFGDTVRAQVDLALDLRHVDPSSVKVRTSFDPWRRVGPVQVDRTDAGSSSHIRMTYVLRCLKQPCVPERDTLPFTFDPARIEFVNRAGGRGALRAPFPVLITHTRIGPTDLATAAPWRLDVTNVPEPSYRTSPGLLLALLIAAALVLLAGAGGLAYAGWPRRIVEAEPEPEPEPEILADAAGTGPRAAGGRGACERRCRPAPLARARRRGARRARGGGRPRRGGPCARVVAERTRARQDEEPGGASPRRARGGAAPARGGTAP